MKKYCFFCIFTIKYPQIYPKGLIMKILLAPSETKINGGNNRFDINKLSFPALNSTRQKLLSVYTNIVTSNDKDSIKKIFGLKKDKDIEPFLTDITNEPIMKAIQRYTGVAFDYLEYNTLNKKAQIYIDNNVLLFSNLFGVLKASDYIPNYRLKQGEMLQDIKIDLIYKPEITSILDKYLQDDDILDIRATYYDKFYKPSCKYTTLKFLKNGKVVSHWAKAYRGMVLKAIALNNIQTIDEFLKLPIQGLAIQEIIEKKNYNQIIYEIDDA